TASSRKLPVQGTASLVPRTHLRLLVAHALTMNAVVAYASAEDRSFFSVSLSDLTVVFDEGFADLRQEGIEIVSIVHGKPMGSKEMDLFPDLRLIVTRSTGYDHIDVSEAEARGIAVCNVPEYGSSTVAEFTMGLILSLTRRIPD